MNLVMASVLLLAMLAFQPTLIYGSKGLASGSLRSITGNGKKHSAAAAALSKSASLVMEMDSGDFFVRKARGASNMDALSASLSSPSSSSAATSTVAGSVGGGGGGSGKRGKNNNKKLNKNSASEQTPTSSSSSASSASSLGRKHLDKKISAAGNQQQQQQHGNNKGKQRQVLKSQQHQNHGKRNGNGGGGAGAGSKSAGAAGEKASKDEKSLSTCRYAKSAWTECDAATNSKTRTLTLKKGESNCLPTRTIQKKCKKACRYEKGAWSGCTDGQMTRQDKLKTTGSFDPSSCEAVRSINKKCGANGGKGGKSANKERKNKDKASRRAQQQQA